MRAAGLALRRARARSAALVAIAVVAGAVAASLLALSAASGRAVDDGVRELLADAAPDAAAIRVSQPLGDVEERDAVVGSAVDELFDGIRLDRVRTVRTDDRDGGWVLLADPTLAESAELTAGAWPAAPGEAALQELAAERRGIDVGDDLAVGDGTVVVTALWRPVDASDPRWFGESIVASGIEGERSGPLVVDESRLADVGSPRLRWTLVPDASAADARTMTGLGVGTVRLEPLLRRTGPGNPADIVVESALPATVDRGARAVARAAGMLAVPSVLAALTGGLLLGLLARALAVSRAAEVRLMAGRGASATVLTGSLLAEAAAVVTLGVAAGCGATWALLALVDAAPSAGTTLATAGVSAAIGTAIVAAIGVVEAAAPASGRAEGGRAALLAALAPPILAALPAALAVVQFLGVGGTVVTGTDGVPRVDPVAVAAPALLLVALAAAVPLLVVPLAAVAERIAAAGRALVPVLPLRQLARRSRAAGGAVLAVALGAASLTLAAAYDGTAEVAAVRGGAPADVMVEPAFGPRVDDRTTGVSAVGADRLAGIAAGVSVLDVPASVAGERVAFVAADPAAFAAVTGDPVLDPVAEAATGPAVPDGPSTITVRVSVDENRNVPDGTLVACTVWAVDPLGGAVRLDAGTAAVGASTELEVPAGSSAGGVLRAVEFTSEALPSGVALTVRLDGVAVGEGAAPGSEVEWGPTDEGELRRSTPGVRLTAADTLPPLPVVVSRAFAQSNAAAVGDELSVQLPTVRGATDAEVVAVVERIPGASGSSIAAGLDAVSTRTIAAGGSVPATTALWFAADDDRVTTLAVAESAVRASLDRQSVVLTRDALGSEPITAVTVRWLWIGALICALLGALGFAAVGSRTDAARRAELRPLGSLGWSASGQGDGRALEVVALGLTGLVGGVLAGLLTAAVTVSRLVAGGSGVAVDPLPAAASIAALIAAMLATGAVADLATRRAARRTPRGAS